MVTIGSALFGRKSPKPPQSVSSIAELGVYLNKLVEFGAPPGLSLVVAKDGVIGPLGVSSAYMVRALSGFGTMACCAAGELVAAWVTGDGLPDYARQLSLERHEDPAYAPSLVSVQLDGEL